MCRFVPSMIAISLVLGVVPVNELRAIALVPAIQDDATQSGGSPPSSGTSPTPSPQIPSLSSAPAPNSQNGASSESLGGEGEPAAGRDPGSSATGNGKPAPGFMDGFFSNPLNLILLMFVALYVFLLLVPKPGRKEQKALQERLANLKKNDRVVLSSGIHGVVANINAEAGTVTVRVDESTNTRLTVDRASIRSVEA
jgi:preprotein translocase YajC subunit